LLSNGENAYASRNPNVGFLQLCFVEQEEVGSPGNIAEHTDSGRPQLFVLHKGGGEDRFWLGPEGGQYALYFNAGDPFDLDHYNDRPPAPGKPPLGPFYEIETSSPALDLAPGQRYTHVHRTFHFLARKLSSTTSRGRRSRSAWRPEERLRSGIARLAIARRNRSPRRRGAVRLFGCSAVQLWAGCGANFFIHSA
jgi:hypothetical protein